MTRITPTRRGESDDASGGFPEPSETAPTGLATRSAEPGQESAGWLARLRRSARLAAPAIGLYLVLRVVSLEIMAILANDAHQQDPGRKVYWDGSTDTWRGWTSLVDALVSWDGRWYSMLAGTGAGGPIGGTDPNGVPYELRVMFFPLYPWLARPLTYLPFVSPATACLVVSFVAVVAAAWGMFVIGRHVHSDRLGIMLAGLWAVAPSAMAQNGAFTESLFTALAAWALYAVLTERWLVAGALAGVAGLTRPTAVALIGTVGLAALVAAARRRGGLRPYGAMLLAPLGYLGYIAYASSQVGGVTRYFDIHRNTFGAWFDFGESTWDVVWGIFLGVNDDATKPIRVISVFFLVGFMVCMVLAAVDRAPWELLVFTAAMFVLAAGSHAHISMLGRHLLPAFPVLLVPAAVLARASTRTVVLVLAPLALLSGWYAGWLPFISGQAI